MYWHDRRFFLIGSVDVSGANSSTPWEPGESVDIKRIIGIMTTAKDATKAVITVTKRKADGSTSSSTLGTFEVAASQAVNTVFYVEPGKVTTSPATAPFDGSVVYKGYVPGLISLNPGDEILFTSDGGGSTGVVTFYVEYQSKGFGPVGLAATSMPYTAA